MMQFQMFLQQLIPAMEFGTALMTAAGSAACYSVQL